MPKNTDGLRSKSKRKPLRDVSNAKLTVKPADNLKKNSDDDRGQMGDDSLDRILLVQSDISSLVAQIDELVVQALQLPSNKGKEIKQFADALSDMQASLKPWIPRLHEALSSQSEQPREKSVQDESKDKAIDRPLKTKCESLVSPSPLVSWRAECNTEGGRQLFLLTPVPQKQAFSSKFPASPILAFENDENKTHLKCGASAKFCEANFPVLVMTPCLKMSPPKSCILLEPISEFNNKKALRARKSTPFPTRVENCSDDSEDSESSSSSRFSDHLAMKYPELFGIRRKNSEKGMVEEEEESPDWVVSPPMTCVIMEPADEKFQKNKSCNLLPPKTAAVTNQGGCKTHQSIESTPMLKEPMSSFRRGKHPGENTLKRELWTRFEAASIGPILESDNNAAKKGFLDQLDEVLDS